MRISPPKWSLIVLCLVAFLAFGCNYGDGDGQPEVADVGDDDSGDNDVGDDDLGDDDSGDDDVDPVDVTWAEGCNPFATSSECVFPYPSSFYQTADADSPTGYRVDYPQDVLPVDEFGDPVIDVGPTNAADGCPPAGPILLHLGADVDPAFLTKVSQLEYSESDTNPIAIFDYETGERVMFMSEMDRNRKDDFPDRYALIVRPMEPMEMGHRHVVVLTTDITDDEGNSFVVPEPFRVLRDNVPTTNETLEGVRPKFEEIFDFLAARGYPRDNLYLAWDFMVAGDEFLLGSVMSMRDEALAEMGGTGLDYVIESVEVDPNEYLARIVKGTFEVPTYLNADNEFDYDADHHPIRQAENLSFPFTMLVPKKAYDGEPLPLLVFGHGLFGSGRSYLTGWARNIIQPLAEDAGVVIVATDWIGLSSGDLELILTQVLPDLNRITLVTDRLQQSLINNLTLTELTAGDLQDDPQVKVADNALIDTDNIIYYGVSLGGIQGSSFLSITNRITRGVLAVPGSVWLNMIPRSTNWPPIKAGMDLIYPDPLIQQLGIAIIQTRFDHSDPVNLTRALYTDPPPDAPERTVLLQESIGDTQVPNMTTEMLARAIGVDVVTPSVYDVYGLETAAAPTTESVLVQYHLVEQEQANPPPEENIPPPVENNVHSDMVFLPHVMQQVKEFLAEGTIYQHCDGSCDPD